MSMPVTGLLILLFLLFCFSFRPHYLPRAVVFFVPFTGTAVLNVESVPIGLSPSYVAMALVMLSWAVHGGALRRYTVSKNHLLQVLALVVFLFTALFSLLVPALFSDARDIALHAPVSSLFTQTVYIAFGVITAVMLSFEFRDPEQLERIITTARWSSLFVCFWAVVQGVCFYGHIPYPAVLFNNSVSKSADMFAQDFSSIVRLASVAVEPSVMVFSLLHFLAFGMTVVLLEPKLRTRSWMISTGITAVLILGSTSSTGYIGLIVLTALLALRRPLQVLLGSLPPLMLGAIALTVFPEFRRILWEVTFDKSDSYSYMVRMDAVRESFELFFRNPVFGAGWGAVTPGDLFGTILGNSGMLGLITFLIVIGALLVSLHHTAERAGAAANNTLRVYAIGAQNSIIVCLVCSMASGMKYYFLDDWSYWAIAIAISSQLVQQPFAERRRALHPSLARGAGQAT